MRERFRRPLRGRPMARRPGEEGGISLGPRERRLLGWIVALVLVVGVAVAVGVLGGNGDGAPVAPGASATPSASGAAAIAFGTALDAATGEVPADARTDRFVAADEFAYSVPPRGTPPPTVYVEVERIGGGTAEVVQQAAPDGEQSVPEGRAAIAFRVPAAVLLDAFGPGEYRMRIFLDPAAQPIAEGTFILLAEVAPSSVTPSGSP